MTQNREARRTPLTETVPADVLDDSDFEPRFTKGGSTDWWFPVATPDASPSLIERQHESKETGSR